MKKRMKRIRTYLVILLFLLGLLGSVDDGLVELEGVVAHQHLIEELREEGELESSLLVVIGPLKSMATFNFRQSD